MTETAASVNLNTGRIWPLGWALDMPVIGDVRISVYICDGGENNTEV